MAAQGSGIGIERRRRMVAVEIFRQHISEARARLAQAIEAASGDWEGGAASGDWAPRKIAEHALATEINFTSAIAASTGNDMPASETLAFPAEGEEFDFSTAAAAIEAIPHVAQACDAVLLKLTEDDMESKSPVVETVFGTLVLTAHHMNLHALQIKEL